MRERSIPKILLLLSLAFFASPSHAIDPAIVSVETLPPQMSPGELDLVVVVTYQYLDVAPVVDVTLSIVDGTTNLDTGLGANASGIASCAPLPCRATEQVTIPAAQLALLPTGSYTVETVLSSGGNELSRADGFFTLRVTNSVNVDEHPPFFPIIVVLIVLYFLRRG